jgi:uncharacterized protein YkwD
MPAKGIMASVRVGIRACIMVIIIDMVARYCALALILSVTSLAQGQTSVAPTTGEHVSAAAIIRELNLARQKPAIYAGFVGQLRVNHSLRTGPGAPALDEAIRFLRTVHPQPPFSLSPGLCQAAADHCRDQVGGLIGHNGSDRSSPDSRINRYGRWQGGWAENIAYGQRNARAIVLALIIDDGVRGRGHRKNIFNAIYNVAGAAYGPHARFGSICGIDFAGAYVESAVASAN